MMVKSKSKKVHRWTNVSCKEAEASNNQSYALRYNRKVVNKGAKLERDRERYLKDGVMLEEV